MTTNNKIDKKNDSSSRNCQGQPVTSSPSTPIARKPCMNTEESPDLDYSPILLPYTQENSNEVAWDWQSSLRTPENRNKRQKIQYETPKGTKLLHKTRNSNSPLLHKPLKRKTIKMENIENIERFAAELQALNERMRVIKQNDKNPSSDCVKEEKVPLLTNISSKEKMLEVKDNKQDSIGESINDNGWNSVGETNDQNNTSKKEASGSYDDLFDDSVDDDMIKCTQEIEKKFNFMDKGNSIEIKMEKSCSNDMSNKTSVQFSSSETCKKPLVKSILGANDTLKTYSKVSSRRDVKSSTYTEAQRSKDSYKPCLNNNNIIHSHVKKPCDKKLPKNDTIDLFDFPDDSFDDWLVTCVEDEKLLSESDVSLTCKNDSTKFQANYKRLTNAPLKLEAKSADSLKPIAKPETSGTSLENRKFFKTKSLSDQYVNRDANIKSIINASCYAPRSMLHSNSSRGPVSRTIVRSSVSTKSIVTNDRKIENNAISLMYGVGRTHGSDRCAVKNDGDCFIKHHSTGNIKNDIPKKTKTGSQPTRCTAEEIERKRLQAVAKLEAKRKLYFTKITNHNINR